MSLWTRLRAGLAHLFYQYFFRLLIVAASVGQWAVVAWVANVAFQTTLPAAAHVLGIVAFYVGNRWLTGTRTRGRGALFHAYTAVAFVALFCAAFLLATTVAFAVVHGVLGAISAEALTETRQALIGAGVDDAFRWIASAGMAAIALLMGYGYLHGQHELEVTRVPLSIPAMNGGRRTLTVAQISDIHIGQNLSVAQLRAFVARVNATAPDLICITGDIADSPLADYATCFPVLGMLRARYGVCAILGNHDHYAGAERVIDALRRWTTFRVFRDHGVTLDLDGTALHVIGLDDRGRDWARGVRSDAILAALLESAPAGVPVLLLSHRPDIFHQAAAAGVALTLAGHTHGGQLALPWFGGRRRNLAEFVTPFDRGLYSAGASRLYVNCGLGVTGQRIRLFTPREITVFELSPG
jgi:predicted MPP superfamily phosphohydrolase